MCLRNMTMLVPLPIFSFSNMRSLSAFVSKADLKGAEELRVGLRSTSIGTSHTAPSVSWLLELGEEFNLCLMFLEVIPVPTDEGMSVEPFKGDT